MNAIKKQRMKTVMKYTWPFYILAGLIVFVLLGVIFKIAHPIPAYKSLTIFISGEVTDRVKLSGDIQKRFEDKKIRSFSSISCPIEDIHYRTKLTVAGYKSADVLIIPTSKLDGIEDLGTIAISLNDELINSFYSGYTFYTNNEKNYGVKVDKDKVSGYMNLPNEDCYMILNGVSQNLGAYGLNNPVAEHDMALQIVKDWGM